MKALILGGTEFVGRALVDAAVARGDEVTVLNRGTRPVEPPARHLVADRRDRVAVEQAIRQVDRRWDVVIDTWSWEPYVVRDSARVLEPLVNCYLYVSTRSVYADPLPAGSDESAPTIDGSADDGDPSMHPNPAPVLDYARMKRGAEIAVVDAFGDRATLVRPGLILGPHENIGRLPWWLSRMAHGGEVLAPGRPESGIQYVDSRDLADFILLLAERRVSGIFDAVSPVGHATLGRLLEACASVAGSAEDPPRLRWMPEKQVLSARVQPWIELPIWLPQGEDHAAMHESDVSKAVSAGLRVRPVEQTVQDTWTWLRSIGGVPPQRTDRPVVGLDPHKEAEILAAAG